MRLPSCMTSFVRDSSLSSQFWNCANGPVFARLRGIPSAMPYTRVFSFPIATPASYRIHGRSILRSVRRHTTSDADSSFFMSVGYHSAPYSIPCVPFVSEERNIFKTPILELLTSLPNASASSASWLSWLTKINGIFEWTVISSLFVVDCSTFGCLGMNSCSIYENIKLMQIAKVQWSVFFFSEKNSFVYPSNFQM